MSHNLGDAIAARLSANATRTAKPFEPDPDLERLGAQLDLLRENAPGQYADPGLGHLKTRVFTYRDRKLQHQENHDD